MTTPRITGATLLTAIACLSCATSPEPSNSGTRAQAPAEAPATDDAASPEWVLVYASDRSGEGDLYVDCLNGSPPRLLVGGPRPEWGPRWRGDGLAFVRDGAEGQAAQVMLWTPEAERELLATNPAVDEAPVWAREGQRIAFPSADDAGVVRVMHGELGPDGTLSALAPLSASASVEPWFDPTGERVALVSDGDVHVVDLASGADENLTQTPDASEGHARWDPHGDRLLVWSDRSGDPELWAIDVETRAWTQLTDVPGADILGAWSPDGRWLVIGSSRDGDWELYLASATGEDPRRLTERPGFDGDPQWVPAAAVGCTTP